MQASFNSENSKSNNLLERKESLLNNPNLILKYRTLELSFIELNQIQINLVKVNKRLREYTSQIDEIKLKLDNLDKCTAKFKAKYKRYRRLKTSSIELFATEELESIVTVLGLSGRDYGSRSNI